MKATLSNHDHEKVARQFDTAFDEVFRIIEPFLSDEPQSLEKIKAFFPEPGKEEREFILSWLHALPTWLWLEILLRIQYVAVPWACSEGSSGAFIDPTG